MGDAADDAERRTLEEAEEEGLTWPVPEGIRRSIKPTYIYDLSLKGEIRADGMHQAPWLERLLKSALETALVTHGITIESGPWVTMRASDKNFAPKEKE